MNNYTKGITPEDAALLSVGLDFYESYKAAYQDFVTYIVPDDSSKVPLELNALAIKAKQRIAKTLPPRLTIESFKTANNIIRGLTDELVRIYTGQNSTLEIFIEGYEGTDTNKLKSTNHHSQMINIQPNLDNTGS